MTITATLPAESPVSIHTQDAQTQAELLKSFAVSPEQLGELLDHFLKRTPEKSDAAIAIWGKPGVGKTAGVRQYARTNDYRLVVLHLQLYDPSDLKGIAVMHEGEVRWVNSSYFPQQVAIDAHLIGTTTEMPVELAWPNAEHLEIDCPDDPSALDNLDCVIVDPTSMVRFKLKPGIEEFHGRIRIQERAIIFLDEISTANTDVQNAALSLVLDRRIGEYALPSSCRMIAAGNTEEDGAFVNPISSALANRFIHLIMCPTLSSFLSYAIDRHYDAVTISFLSMYGTQYLHRYRSDNMLGGNYGFATPRTWESYCQQFDASKPEWVQNITAVSILGLEAGTTLIGFRKTTLSLPDAMSILLGKPYTWPKNADRGSGLMMIGILASRIREVYDENSVQIASAKVGQKIAYDRFPKAWTTAINGLYGYMNNHLQPDACVAGHYMITKIAKIPYEYIDGEEYSKFSATHKSTVAATANTRK